ncbi:hypothetical protein [Dethiothermospora halolimnae]|uniref:hypothetical protein n=1 Tax=Dethiothermospora halolimnae TaxID=3114390 RepID=UPI003CCB79CF
MVGPEWFFVYLLELSCVFFIWCHIGIPWKENKFKVIFSVTICAFLMTLVDHLAFRMLLSHLISVLIIYIVFRKKLEDILIELIFVFVSLSILQTPLLLVASNLKGFDLVNPKFQFIIHIFYLIFIATLFNFIPIKKYYKICKGFFKKIYFVMLNLYVLIYIYHFILFMYGYTNFFFFISLITFFVLINIAFVQSLLSSKEEKLLIASYKEQKNTFLPLINEIKSKQHDFKNHLTTIYGLSQNESSESVQNYIETLDHSLKDIDLFFNISNKVISAILYSKTSEAKKIILILLLIYRPMK